MIIGVLKVLALNGLNCKLVSDMAIIVESLKFQDIIQTLERLNLGLIRDNSVTLKTCYLDWRKAFATESARICAELKDSNIKLHHIGSTSIPSILAKPILDILVEVTSIDIIDHNCEKFEKLGYEYKGEYGVQGRRYCTLYSTDNTKGYVHLHAFAAETPEFVNHLLFRDYLLAHPNRAADYQALKLDLLKQPEMNRVKYSESKTSFIKEILKEARAWQ